MTQPLSEPVPIRSTYRSTRRPLSTVVASAQRVTSQTLQRGWGRRKDWQDDAWSAFDLVGEHRFLAITLAQRMSQARLYVGKISEDQTEEPVQIDDSRFTDILESIGSSSSARAQLIARLGTNLFVAGDGWLVGIPRYLLPPGLLVGTLNEPIVDPELIQVPEPGTLDITDLDWRMMSISEVTNSGGEVQLRLGETTQDQLIVNPDLLVLVRVWRPHPRYWWEADSPTRSSLPILRELIGLSMRSSAEIDSRLAGAGLLIVPQSAQRAMQIAAGIEDDLDTAPDQFTEALMEAMIKPISDRSSASAVVPLVATVPDEACQLFNFIDFAKPLDQFAAERLNEAIRRLALGLDAPPELLLGTGGMNHWGAWLVLEDVVTTHLEPPLALICDALTTQYLWPVLVDQGMTPAEAKQYVIWYDVSDLVVRPTRSADAATLHTAGVISDAAFRDATGFDDSDAPVGEAGLPTEVQMALDLIRAAPGLMSDPGLPQLVAQFKAVLEGDIPEVIDPAKTKEEAATKAASPGKEQGSANTADTGPAVRGALPAKGVQSPSLKPVPSIAAAASQREVDGLIPGEKYAFEQTAGAASLPEAVSSTLKAAGIAVKAADTGRVLMLQRSLSPDDPAAGMWEFPGGKIDPGEDPLATAQREWSEETGHAWPTASQTGQWTSSNGVYQGYVFEVISEDEIQLNLDHEDRSLLNPDDPDGDEIEVIAWWMPDQLQDNPALRTELATDLDIVLQAINPSPNIVTVKSPATP